MSTHFERWMAELEERHLRDLQFSEAARALRALSTTYVERRERLESKSSFDSAGKRAAYALYYSPLHYLTVQNIVASIDAGRGVRHILDLGCGAGAAGAAWAASQPAPAAVTGLDTHPWALNEAALTYRVFGLDGSTRRANALQLTVPRSVDAIAAGWMLNEVTEQTRLALQRTLRDAVKAGRRLLVVEPIATRVSPWWNAWSAPFVAAGARVDEWRFRVELPDIVQRLGRAAGLRHEALTARSLAFPGS
jgi:ubiquinone/menaquinone biosynthesis C-methylase UbiE